MTALRVQGSIVQPLLLSELQLAHAFGWGGRIEGPTGEPAPAATADPPPGDAGAVQLQWLGEGAIRDAVLQHIDAAGNGDSIDIATDVLAERSVIAALLAASRRGAAVRLILDPHKTASLWRSANQSVGSELLAASADLPAAVTTISEPAKIMPPNQPPSLSESSRMRTSTRRARTGASDVVGSSKRT